MKNKLNKIRQLIESTNRNFNKEMRYFVLGIFLTFIIGGLLFYQTRSLMSIYLAIILLVAYIYMFFSRYQTILKKLKKDRFDEFITLISYFQTFIYNHNNIYQSFKKLLNYCSPWMKDALNRLLIEIDNDKSIQPFVNFSSLFEEKIVYNIMLSIYQMIDQGENSENLNQFFILFNQINVNRNEEKKKNKEKSFDIINVFPMVGAASITVVLSVVLISVMGDLVNVI